jgi:hypothetical protein
MEVLRGASIFALLTIFMGLTPLLMAIVYVLRPTDQNLALMRPVSLAGIFGALCGTVAGLIAILRGFGVMTEDATVKTYHVMAIAFAEALVPVFVCFGCLTIAWLLVALGMRRAA